MWKVIFDDVPRVITEKIEETCCAYEINNDFHCFFLNKNDGAEISFKYQKILEISLT